MQICAASLDVGYTSFTDGFVPTRTNLFDEVRKDPQAVCNRLMNNEDWELAEWVMDNFLQLPHVAKST
jgi:succinate dehydrogenase flavin-adding protein (antitoxin of CptAB toxin-antitoxin module)